MIGHNHPSIPAESSEADDVLLQSAGLLAQDTVDGFTTVPGNTPTIATPQRSMPANEAAEPSGVLLPSTAKSYKDPPINAKTGSLRALRKLQQATTRSETPSAPVSLSSHGVDASTGTLRRSNRLESRNQAQNASASSRKRARTSRVTKTAHPKLRFPRRSARLSKPLTQFHKYGDLPPEILHMIWEEALEGRTVYIRNSAALGFSLKVQNPQPVWLTTDIFSEDIAERNYKMMFDATQLVDPHRDIIIMEPCCNGCRGYWCAISQFSEESRRAVRFMAVQTDSRYLMPSAQPGWVSVSRAFPNVETLYLLRRAVKGDQTTEKALLRIKKDDHESRLLKRFEEWRKGEGKSRSLNRLEFVVAVDREPDLVVPSRRYRFVEERETGELKDIIIG